MPDDKMKIATLLIDTVQSMNAMKINQGASGNASVRFRCNGEEGILITPSGLKYEALKPQDIVFMPFDGDGDYVCDVGDRKPSSEWRFHLDIQKSRTDVSAVVHAHGVHAAALASMRKGIPPFHYMVAIAGGYDIRCAPYATFGTQLLSDFALEALTDRKACLLGNHGLISCGSTLEKALDLAIEVEALSSMYLKILSVGEPSLLTEEEMDQAIHQFQNGYGQTE